MYKNMTCLVERLREVSVQRLAVSDGLTHYPTNELEVHKVLRVHVRHRVRLERSTIGRRYEQRVILVEDVSG